MNMIAARDLASVLSNTNSSTSRVVAFTARLDGLSVGLCPDVAAFCTTFMSTSLFQVADHFVVTSGALYSHLCTIFSHMQLQVPQASLDFCSETWHSVTNELVASLYARSTG